MDRTIVLSYGAGVQSTALLLMSNRGDYGVPKASVAYFADTQDEPSWVYEQLESAQRWSSIPIEIVTAGRLSDSIRAREGRSFLPAFTEPEGDGRHGMLNRKCTREFKVNPIEQRISRLVNRSSAGKSPPTLVTLMIGISVDEAHRMKPNNRKWIENVWPLIDARLTRNDCEKYLQAHGIEAPKKSACVFCPFRSDYSWKNLKKYHPSEWLRAVEVDRMIRDLSWAHCRSPVFLHPSLKPLEDVDLQETQIEMFGNECEGYCGV